MEESMKTIIAGLTLVLALLLAPGLRAQEAADDPLARLLFAPELVMRHQAEIGLSPEQRSAITRAIADFQSRVVEVQWRMQDATQKLLAVLGKPHVDQAAALAQVDEVLNLERGMKREHLTLLIQIKNTLTPEQQGKLTALRGP
jgi:Spy/CpxP family protein refolding chaperone